MNIQPINCELLDALPLHGGDIEASAKHFNIPYADWVDLSTGMNPFFYPVTGIPECAFTQLPYLQQEFLDAAQRYYHQKNGLAVAGTQAAIQLLPSLLSDTTRFNSGYVEPECIESECIASKSIVSKSIEPKCIESVLLPEIGYSEHSANWQKRFLKPQGVESQRTACANGLTLNIYSSGSLTETVCSIDAALNQNPYQHLVIINPNNPTGVVMEQSQLLKWADRLGDGAYLIVDEAFMDADCAELADKHTVFHDATSRSLLIEKSLPENIIVLRSFGKFFGLAGVRLGFVFANTSILDLLQEKLGLWQINGPAQYVATQAFNDVAWQKTTLKRLYEHHVVAQSLLSMLLSDDTLALPPNLLFTTYCMPLKRAVRLYQCLASQGILTRVIPLKNINLNAVGSLDGRLDRLESDAKGLLRIGVFDTQDKALYARVQDALNQAVANVNQD